MDEAEKLDIARQVHVAERLLHRYCVSRFDAEGHDGSELPALTFPQVNMIMTVRNGDCMNIKQLAEELDVKAPAVSAMVDRLVEMGLLTRTENPEDRREVQVRVSSSHEAFIDHLERRKLQAFAELVEKVGLDYARMWRKVAERLQEVLEEERRQQALTDN